MRVYGVQGRSIREATMGGQTNGALQTGRSVLHSIRDGLYLLFRDLLKYRNMIYFGIQ